MPRLLQAFCVLGARAAPRHKPLDHGWAPPGACVFVGNRADKHYCATTGTQILANPETYDGHLIDVSGWVVSSPDGRSAILYLTRDARETTATQASVNLYGSAVLEIAKYALQSKAAFSPVSVRVQGRFRLYGLAPDGTRSNHADEAFKFGVVDEVNAW